MAIRRPDSLPVAPGDVDIWYRLTDSISQPALIAARALLSREERMRCDHYRLACDKRDYAIAHALLRTSLSRYGAAEPQAWIFRAGAYGKPQLAVRHQSMTELSFNLSHACGIVACAIAPGPSVGIDVVRTDVAFDYSSVGATYLSPDELAQLDACVPEERIARFMELWALKEAYAKATGRGLTEAVSELTFLIDASGIRFLPPPNVNPQSWQFELLTLEPHYRIAVAVERPDTSVWRIRARSADIDVDAPADLTLTV